MATSTEIKQRANALSDKTDVNSITPKEVGGIMYDLASHGENVLRNGGTLGIRKVYESVAAMEADSTNPKDFWGDPIKKGNLVVIYDGTTTGADNNKIYAFMKPGWELATKLDAAYATKAETDAKLSELGSEIKSVYSPLDLYPDFANLFNKNDKDCILGKGLYGNDWYEGGFNTSGYIKVKPSTEYIFSYNGSISDIRWINYFDESKNLISFINNASKIITPINCRYVRLSIKDTIWDMTQMEEGNIVTSYHEFKYLYGGESIKEKSINISSFSFLESENKINVTDKDCLIGKFVYGDNIEDGPTLNTTGYIAVKPNKKYSYFASDNSPMRFITWYDENKNVIGYNQNQRVFEATNRTYFVRITIHVNNWGKSNFSEGGNTSNYVPFLETIPLRNILQNRFSGYRYKGQSLNGNVDYLCQSHISKNISISLAIDTEAITDIAVGLGKNEYGGYFVNLTSDSIIVYGYESSKPEILATYNHGLILNDRTYLHINSKDDSTARITLACKGDQYIVDNAPWRGRGVLFVQNNNPKYIDYEISMQMKDVLKDVWIFGDSYYSHDAPARHLYHIYKNGYKDFLLNNKGGIASVASLSDLKEVLSFHKNPKYILWGLGMNDDSDADEDNPNDVWLSCISSVIEICEELCIIPILSTIPSAYDSNGNKLYYHDGKSKWVRNSGYRYIDYAKAVGADSNGQWIEGCKHSDVHPTEKGAIMLAHQMMIDFPEIMVKS